MAAENTLLFAAHAIRCSSQFHLQNPDLLKKWWMSWPRYCFFPFLVFFFLSFFLFFIFFSIPLKIEALSLLGSEANSAPPLLTVSNHFKVWCWLWPEPFGTWLLCSGSRQELRFVICRWHEQCLACGCWAGFFCKAKSVMCDMMWLGLTSSLLIDSAAKNTVFCWRVTVFVMLCVFSALSFLHWSVALSVAFTVRMFPHTLRARWRCF